MKALRLIVVNALVILLIFLLTIVKIKQGNTGAYSCSSHLQFVSELEKLELDLVIAMTRTKMLMNTVDAEIQMALAFTHRKDTERAVETYRSALRHIDETFKVAAPELLNSVDAFIRFVSIPNILLPDYIQAMSSMDFRAVLDRRIREGDSPASFGPAWSRAAQILSGRGQQGIIDLFKEMRKRIEAVGQAYTAWADAYRRIEPMMKDGTYYAETERTLRLTGKLPQILALDEKADASRYEFHVFYDVVLAIGREAIKVAPAR